MDRNVRKGTTGEVMLEGMIIVILTLFILIWILGLGFVYYQKYVTTVATNDAVVKIASTYHNPSSDIVMGFVTSEALGSRPLYRNFPSSTLKNTNEDRAEAYIRYSLERVNVTGAVKDVNVTMKYVQDSYVRAHVEITTTCTFNTPFGIGLEMFGMNATPTYQATACADCTDYIDAISTLNYEKAWKNGTFTAGMGVIDKFVKAINKFVSVLNG